MAAGLLIGVPIAIWGRHFVGTLIKDLPAEGGFTVMFGAVGMIGVAALASYLPARRASRVDPMVALRYE